MAQATANGDIPRIVEDDTAERRKINPHAFWPGYVVLVLFIGIGLMNQQAFKAVLDTCNAWLSTNFGWLNVLSSILIVLFTFCIAFSRIGDIRLGGEDAKPEYTLWQWFFHGTVRMYRNRHSVLGNGGTYFPYDAAA